MEEKMETTIVYDSLGFRFSGLGLGLCRDSPHAWGYLWG